MLETLETLPAADAGLLWEIAETLNDRANRAMLDTFEVRSTAPAVPLEVPWPPE